MPLTRIEIPAGAPAACRAAVGEAVREALHAALGVPPGERFPVVAAHLSGGLVTDPGHLGVDRSPEAIRVQVVREGRDTERKRGVYRTLADGLHAEAGLRREDDRSFGDGEARLAL